MEERQEASFPPILDYGVVRRKAIDWIRLLAWVLPPLVLLPLGIWLLHTTLFHGYDLSDSNVFLFFCGALFAAFGLFFPLAKLTNMAINMARPATPIARQSQLHPLSWAGPDGKLAALERMRNQMRKH